MLVRFKYEIAEIDGAGLATLIGLLKLSAAQWQLDCLNELCAVFVSELERRRNAESDSPVSVFALQVPFGEYPEVRRELRLMDVSLDYGRHVSASGSATDAVAFIAAVLAALQHAHDQELASRAN